MICAECGSPLGQKKWENPLKRLQFSSCLASWAQYWARCCWMCLTNLVATFEVLIQRVCSLSAPRSNSRHWMGLIWDCDILRHFKTLNIKVSWLVYMKTYHWKHRNVSVQRSVGTFTQNQHFHSDRTDQNIFQTHWCHSCNFYWLSELGPFEDLSSEVTRSRSSTSFIHTRTSYLSFCSLWC